MATNNIEKQSFGQAGATYESGTDPIESEFCAILVVAACKFHTLDWDELDDSGQSGASGHHANRRLAHTTEATADIIPAGVTIYGQITKIQLHSGAVLAYKSA